MSFIILPKNATKTAVLVEQNEPVVINDSTPVEVNVQQPVSVDDNSASITVDTDDGPVSTSMYSEDLYRQLSLIDINNQILKQLKIMNMQLSLMTDTTLTREDI